jgi:hypothetical protein
LHAFKLNLIFLRSEVIGGEGNLLVWNFSQILVIVVLVVSGRATFSQITTSEWLLKLYFVKIIKWKQF